MATERESIIPEALADRVYDALPKRDDGEPYYSLTAIRLVLEAAGMADVIDSLEAIKTFIDADGGQLAWETANSALERLSA